ncbi:MAG: hypothetical protein RL318_2332, partial [Fibrobacterota bacterium]
MARSNPFVAVVEATGEVASHAVMTVLRAVGRMLFTLGELFSLTFQIFWLFRTAL